MFELLDNSGIKPLVIYKCGSKLFELETERSDADYTVIARDFNGELSLNDEGIDYFVFGIESFKKMLRFEAGILPTFNIWIDNVTLAKDNIVYIDPAFEKEFFEIINIDWKPVFNKWLVLNLDYLRLILKYDSTEKILWTIYRLHSIVKNFKEKGIFLSKLNDDDAAFALDYKLNESLRSSHTERLNKIFSELELIAKEE